MSLRARAVLAAERLRPLAPAVVIVALLALVPFSTCIFKFATGLPCPGCGFTRAIVSIVRGDLAASLRWHPLAIPGCVLAIATLVLALALPPGHSAWASYRRHALNGAAAALVAVWVLRLAHVIPAV